VRKLVKWTIVTLGIAALVRWLKRRGQEPAIAPSEAADDPADALRRKLAESRPDVEPDTAAETPAASVDERRADVHEKGRSALSDMAPPDGD
jgi:hypothetical protein